MTVVTNMHNYDYEGVMSVLYTPLQVKCYQMNNLQFRSMCRFKTYKQNVPQTFMQHWMYL